MLGGLGLATEPASAAVHIVGPYFSPHGFVSSAVVACASSESLDVELSWSFRATAAAMLQPIHSIDSPTGMLCATSSDMATTVQFCISPPKTDMENTVVVDDYAKMDRILREERNYILQTIKKIRASGCNVLLIQKSILRDAVTDLSLHYLVRPCLRYFEWNASHPSHVVGT